MEKAGTYNGQSVIEEWFNSLSHGIGAILAILGTMALINIAMQTGNIINVVSMSLYGASMIVLYTNSTLYHATTNFKVKRVLQILDHCSIFLLIWGTYVPVALLLISGTAGWVIFGVQTFCAIAGIVLNAIDMKKFKKFSLVLYVVMGWSIVINLQALFNVIDIVGGFLLVAGGLAYTIGILFYIKKDKMFYHFIWHLFVVAGSLFHYMFVIRFC